MKESIFMGDFIFGSSLLALCAPKGTYVDRLSLQHFMFVSVLQRAICKIVLHNFFRKLRIPILNIGIGTILNLKVAHQMSSFCKYYNSKKLA